MKKIIYENDFTSMCTELAIEWGKNSAGSKYDIAYAKVEKYVTESSEKSETAKGAGINESLLASLKCEAEEAEGSLYISTMYTVAAFITSTICAMATLIYQILNTCSDSTQSGKLMLETPLSLNATEFAFSLSSSHSTLSILENCIPSVVTIVAIVIFSKYMYNKISKYTSVYTWRKYILAAITVLSDPKSN